LACNFLKVIFGGTCSTNFKTQHEILRYVIDSSTESFWGKKVCPFCTFFEL
jgi:hypothetical protein